MHHVHHSNNPWVGGENYYQPLLPGLFGKRKLLGDNNGAASASATSGSSSATAAASRRRQCRVAGLLYSVHAAGRRRLLAWRTQVSTMRAAARVQLFKRRAAAVLSFLLPSNSSAAGMHVCTSNQAFIYRYTHMHQRKGRAHTQNTNSRAPDHRV